MTQNLKQELANQIKKNRPRLSDKSVTTYVSTLANLPKKYGTGRDDIGIEWFDENSSHIVSELKDTPATKRKSILSALYILTQNKAVHTDMITDAKAVNELYKQQKKSVNEEQNWIAWGDVETKYNDMQKQATMIMKKKMISPEDFSNLNKFVLLSCYVLFPPRRVMDYANMKIRNFDKETDNFIDKTSWTFNKYKTVKVYGRQSFPISKELQSIFKKWATINTNDYLVVNTKNKPLTSSGITTLLNSIFEKEISCNILRHSFLTHMYSGKMPTLVEMQDMATKLAHSVSQSMLYIKQD